MTVLAMQANATIATERKTQFDTDSEMIGIDNRCSGCISHVRDDFVGELRRTDRVVKGFAGTKTTNVQVGTLRWSWEDDLGRKHTFTIPNSYYVPDGRVRLLSPQHWSQTQTTGPRRDQCGEYTNGRECVLFWGGGKHKMRIPLGKRDNVATFSMASGFDKFRAFCCEAELDETTRNVIAMPTGFVSDDEDDDDIDSSDEARATQHGEVRANPALRQCSATSTAHPVRPQRGRHLRHQRKSNRQPKSNQRQPTWTCREQRT